MDTAHISSASGGNCGWRSSWCFARAARVWWRRSKHPGRTSSSATVHAGSLPSSPRLPERARELEPNEVIEAVIARDEAPILDVAHEILSEQ